MCKSWNYQGHKCHTCKRAPGVSPQWGPPPQDQGSLLAYSQCGQAMWREGRARQRQKVGRGLEEASNSIPAELSAWSALDSNCRGFYSACGCTQFPPASSPPAVLNYALWDYTHRYTGTILYYTVLYWSLPFLNEHSYQYWSRLCSFITKA